MERSVIIVAGGKGLRMGGDLPKQFLPLHGKPVLMHTIESFAEALPGIGIILVLPLDHQAYWHELCQKYDFTQPHVIATGGHTRFHSVKNGLAAIPQSVTDAIVGVHDGVRPFASHDVIRTCFAAAEVHRAVVPVTPVVETLRRIDGNDAAASVTVDRSQYRLVQTPQTFQLQLLRQAYEQPYRDTFTDDASVVEALGQSVTLVEGNRDNIKLTTPFDLTVAEAILKNEK